MYYLLAGFSRPERGRSDRRKEEVLPITSTSDFRNGLAIELDGQIYRIVEFQHVKPGKGAAFVRTKLKNVETGAVVDKTFRAGEKVVEAVLEHHRMQYLYRDDEYYVLMDLEEFHLSAMEKIDMPVLLEVASAVARGPGGTR